MADKETARIEAFSDGVFAIAITLLALELKVPSPEKVGSNTELWEELRSEWPGYLAFFTSFFSILIMWMNHHALFKHINRVNGPVMFANGLMLFLVTLVNYPTALMAEYLDTPAATTAAAVYAGLFVVINISYNLLWYTAFRHRHLLRPDASESSRRAIGRSYLIGFPAYVVAFLAAFISPLLSLGICTLLWMFWALAIKFNDH